MAQKTMLDFEKPLQILEDQLNQLRQQSQESGVDFSDEIRGIESKIARTRQEIYANLDIWQRIQLARHPQRPYSWDYIERIFGEFEEIHGDRLFGDDAAMVCGITSLAGKPLMVVAQQKGRDLKENIRRNFGCPQPEGYRKALRAMKLAHKFHLPIITFIDTSGAYPGIGSEERHVAEAIAVNICEMSTFEVPIVGIVIGEGGSGGALGIGMVDRLLVLENAYYSVVSPEGCAMILWKDRAKTADAARALCLESQRLLEFGIADEILKEPIGGAHLNFDAMAATVKEALVRHLSELGSVGFLPDQRYKKYRRIGIYD